jgi:CheY-like chemotaxis protein
VDATQSDKEKCLQAGMGDYINKPVKTVQTHEMIQKYALHQREVVMANA